MEHLVLFILGTCALVFSAISAARLENGDRLKLHSNGNSRVDRAALYGEKKGFECPRLFGIFSDPEDCGSYYTCVGGVGWPRKCKPFMHFDKYRFRCLPALIAICDNKGKTTKTTKGFSTTTTATVTPKNKFRCPSFYGTFPDPENCAQYYTCVFYVPTLKTCPEKELFDAIKKQCKPEATVHCGNRMRPTTIPEVSTTVSESEKPTVTIVPDTTTPKVIESDPTTTSSVPTETESLSSETDIITTTIPPPPTEGELLTGPPETNCEEDDLDCIIKDTGDINRWFHCPEDVGYHIHPSSDKLFILCLNWIPSVKKCGMDLVFSKHLLTCVEPE